MAFPDLFKLEKLRISAYKDGKRRTPFYTFRAMFNPESLSQTFQTRYLAGGGVNNPAQVASFGSALPTDLNLKLLIDGTGVGDIGLISTPAPGKAVKDQIDEFLANVYQVKDETHEPAYLIVDWGALHFSCRLSRATVTYTSFDRSGLPLRAELDLHLVADEDLAKQLARLALSSPDVSHSRQVTSGTTLPLLTAEVYGDPRHYLRVARFNGLRRLTPGQELRFPPLASSSTG